MSTFLFNDEQRSIQEATQKLCERFDDDYWLTHDQGAGFPEEFVAAVARDGWLGIAMPERFGGAGLGITEACVMLQAVAESGAGFSGASAIHLNIFGLNPVVVFGTEEQQQRMLPPLIRGEQRACFGVTEPNAGLDTTSIQTMAARTNEGYVVNGRKLWTSSAQTADKILLLARTTSKEASARKTDGISLFYTDLNRDHVEVREIAKMGRKAVDSNAVFIDGLPIPEEDRIGEEGHGFKYILHGLNPERIMIAAEAVGLGRAALRKAVAYAKEREVFGRQIGSNQGIQHPLAKCWAELEAANLMAFHAAQLYDAGEPCGGEANAAKYLAGEACFHACETAVMTHGGMGYAKEYHVERYMREAFISRIAPVSREMILNFIGEKVLEMPRSF
ncbi:MAG: acyl-CoA dehydrogenase family protein [Pseudomonadota bacterium]